MTYNQIINDIVIFLKTIPEIKTCFIEVSSYSINIYNINNTKLFLSYKILKYKDQYITQEMESLLLEANIKQSLVIAIATFLSTLRVKQTDYALNNKIFQARVEFNYEA